jgi:PPP family 3-phenylpropionic acid transporter
MSAVLRWFLVFAFPQNLPILFFAQSLHAVSFALYHTASVGYLFGLYKHKSLAQQLYYGVGYGFGGLSGAMIAGYIYEYYPKYLFLSSSLIALIALYLLKEWHSRSTLRGES